MIQEPQPSEELVAALDDAITNIEEVIEESEGLVLTPQFTANIKEDEKIGASKKPEGKIGGPTFGIVTGIYTPEEL